MEQFRQQPRQSTQGHRPFKSQMYGELGRIGKALASPQRLELLDLLSQGEWTVEDLARETTLSQANTSRHLQALRQARLLATRKAGQYVYYRLADTVMFELWRTLRTAGERQLAEVERLLALYQRDPTALEPMTREALRAAGGGRRDRARCAPGGGICAGTHPRRALHPVRPARSASGGTARRPRIVAYCRGPYCLFAHDALELRAAHGYRARRLRDGHPDWRAAGLPVE